MNFLELINSFEVMRIVKHIMLLVNNFMLSYLHMTSTYLYAITCKNALYLLKYPEIRKQSSLQAEPIVIYLNIKQSWWEKCIKKHKSNFKVFP